MFDRRKPIAVVFYYSALLDHIRIGYPEMFPVPDVLQLQGYEKVVCRNAHQVQLCSDKLRAQERRDEEKVTEQRAAFEEPLLNILRRDLHYLKATARNPMNRDMCQKALDKMEEYERKNKMNRTSYQHIEAFEDGK